MKKRLVIALQLAVTAALLGLLFRQGGFRAQVVEVLGAARPAWLALAVGVALMVHLLGCLRWWVCLRILDVRMPPERCLRLYGISLFGSLFLFGPMGGDAVRIGLLWRDGHARAAAAMSVLLDRTSGLVALIVLAYAFTAAREAWFAQDELASRLVQALWIYLALALLVLVASVVVSRAGWLRRLPRWAPAKAQLVDCAEAWARFSRHGRLAFLTMLISALGLTLYYTVYAACSTAFGIATPWRDLFALLPVVDAAAAIPVSFAGLGVREALFEVLLARLTEAPRSAGALVGLGGFMSMAVWCAVGGLGLPGWRRQKGVHASLDELTKTP